MVDMRIIWKAQIDLCKRIADDIIKNNASEEICRYADKYAVIESPFETSGGCCGEDNIRINFGEAYCHVDIDENNAPTGEVWWSNEEMGISDARTYEESIKALERLSLEEAYKNCMFIESYLDQEGKEIHSYNYEPFTAIENESLQTKAAEAFAFLDWMCIDLGDSYSDEVREICSQMEIEFPENTDEDIPLMELATKAYEKYLEEKPSEIVDNVFYYEDCSNFIMQQIAYVKDADKSIIHAKSLLNYVEEKVNQGVLSKKQLTAAENLNSLLSSVDVSLVCIGRYVGDRLWKKLDGNHYFQSNTGFITGHITEKDENAYALGSYVCYAQHLIGDNGYAVTFCRKKESIIAHVYSYKRKNYNCESNFFIYSDMNYEISLTESALDNDVSKLAAYINTLPIK